MLNRGTVCSSTVSSSETSHSLVTETLDFASVSGHGDQMDNLNGEESDLEDESQSRRSTR